MMSDDEDFDLGFTLNKKGEVRKVNLDETAIKEIQTISQNYKYENQLNGHLDPQNQASPSMLQFSSLDNIDFEHYLLKNKYKPKREVVFDVLRELLEERGYQQINKVNDKLEENSIIVIRIIEKVEGHLNTFRIQDQIADAKLYVKEGIVWLGMICAVRVKFFDGMYRLTRAEDIIDLSMPMQKKMARLRVDTTAHRIMILKGPFRPKFKPEDLGIRLIGKELKNLRKKNVIVNTLILMGPILPKQHQSVKNFTLTKTFEEQYEWIIKQLQAELKQLPQRIKVFVVPSLEDIVSMYPIPQPAYQPLTEDFDNVEFISNPNSLEVEAPLGAKISFINYDIIQYIQKMQGGKAIGEITTQHFTSYMKQPFLLTNTLTKEQAFDQVNFGPLYNKGDFGDFVIFSSNKHKPFFRKIKTNSGNDSRGVLNVGSLGVQFNSSLGYYMSILSIYEGQGDVLERTKLDFITMQE